MPLRVPRTPRTSRPTTETRAIQHLAELAISNPSKAYATVMREVVASGGWVQKQADDYAHVILSGPYTGTYLLGKKKFVWQPDLNDGISLSPRTFGLVKWRMAKIIEKIEPILQVLDAVRPPKIAFAYTEDINTDSSHRGRLIKALQKAVETGKDIQEVVAGTYLEPDSGEDELYLESQAALYKKDPAAYMKSADAVATYDNALRALKGGNWDLAMRLYIMSQAGNVPIEKVLLDVRQQPKRLLSVLANSRDTHVDSMPTSYTDRSRYSRVLLTTWSKQKAIKALIPNIEGHLPANVSVQDLPTARYALQGVPSWAQAATRPTLEPDLGLILEEAAGLRERLLYPPPRYADPKEAYVRSVLDLATRAGAEKFPRKDFRELLHRKGLDWLQIMLDAYYVLPEAREILAETFEGRRALEYYDQKNWIEFSKEHDRVMLALAAVRRAGSTPITPEEAEAFHSKARQFSFPPGVIPLVTEADFKKEGERMRHCVSGYFWQRKSYCFAFEGPDGCRATLELTKKGDVSQFRSEYNGVPSIECKRLLYIFLRRNSVNIHGMRDGIFPVVPLTKKQLGW